MVGGDTEASSSETPTLGDVRGVAEVAPELGVLGVAFGQVDHLGVAVA